MESIVKFKSFACRYDDFDRADLSYPEDQSKPITVEVYMKDGRNITVFAANNILACWLFIETMQIIKAEEQPIDYLKDQAINQQMEKMCQNIQPGLLPHEAFYCCYKKLEYLSDVMIGNKWHCKVCDEKYSAEDIALKKNIKKGSH